MATVLKKRYYCEHCNENVSRSTYRRHQSEEENNKRLKIENEKQDEDLSDEEAWDPLDFETSTTSAIEVDFIEDDSDNEDSENESAHEIDEDYNDLENEVFFDSDSEDDDEDCNYKDKSKNNIIPPIMRAILLFLMLWQALFNVSDAGMSVLVVFLHHVLKLHQSIAVDEAITNWMAAFPLTLKKVQQEVIGNRINFTDYVVCPKCHSLYDLDDCIETNGSIKKGRICSYVEFPSHTRQSCRAPCGSALLRTSRKNSKTSFKPFKIYSYQSLKTSVTRLTKKEGFLDMCDLWKKRLSSDDILGDIYDGQVWRDFKSFLEHKHSWCLALNVDWFQPFSHVSDSVGALYMCILNLPRSERYKREHMILVGIIPGPHEPSGNINSYLTPLVLELQEFYDGVPITSISKIGNSYETITLRLALVGVFCDIPASRKVCGFPSYNAIHGCNKCLKSFPTISFGDKPDYSGFNSSTWPVRDLTTHKSMALEYLHASTKSRQKDIEKTHGLKYSILIDLPYFNPIRFTAIDPMHNLFLGTAKHCMEVWTKQNILSRNNLIIIEERMTRLHAPYSIGRLPLKIGSGFSGFTADQWKNWTISYSAIALRDVLPREHLQYWLLFVKACSLLCTRYLKTQNVQLADQYLHLFCTKYEEVNGKDSCTPNMHLHLHLKQCILDYGPLYSFWCYAFERYNGMLGRFPTNQKHIEPQLMRKCILSQELYSQTFPSDAEFLKNLLLNQVPVASGGLRHTTTDEMMQFINFSLPILSDSLNFKVTEYEKMLPPVKQVVLDDEMLSYLKCTYKLLYPEKAFDEVFRYFAKRSSRASFLTEVYGSKLMSRENNIVIMAYWPSCLSTIPTNSRNLPESVGEIQYFLQHTIAEKDDHLFACVKWYKKHTHWDWFGSSATVCYPEFESDRTYCFIPIKRISSLCIHGKIDVRFNNQQTLETVFVTTPINAKHIIV